MTQDGINPCRGGPGQDTEEFYVQYGAAWGEGWTCTVIPGSEQTLSITAGNQAEAAAPHLDYELQGTVPLRKPQHTAFVLQEWALHTQAF